MARTTRPKSKPRKADNDRNAEGLDEAIARHMKKERRLYPLKINANTYIYVPKKKQTLEYAAQWRERMGLKE